MAKPGGGYRGYIGSRDYACGRVPQHVQNIVVRDYCARHDLPFLVSAAEYAIPGCYIMLDEVLGTLGGIEGIVLYSMFMLPEDRRRRVGIYARLLATGCSLHAAVEDRALQSPGDVQRWEDIVLAQRVMPFCPHPETLVGALPLLGEELGG